MTNKSICSMPWNSLAVRPNGEVFPCCRFQKHLGNSGDWGNLSPTLDFRNNSAWKSIRDKMLAGEFIPECSKCYDEEKRGGNNSMRINSLYQLPKNLTNECTELTFLELAFSNLCNLACISCNADYSSKWATEDYKFKRSNSPSLVEHNINLSNLSKVTTLKIMGGEPFMEQNRFIELLNKFNLSNLELMVFTNGTTIPSEALKLLLDQCKTLKLYVSIDGISSVDEWYRWPTKFNTILDTMDTYEKWWGDNKNVQLNIQTLISIFNIWSLNKITDFIQSRRVKWTVSFNWIIYPAWQQISNIPNVYKTELTAKLKKWKDEAHQVWYHGLGNPFETTIEKLNQKSNTTWENVKINIKTLEKERNLDVLTMVPDMAPLFTE